MHNVNFKLKLCALFLFALASALRLEAGVTINNNVTLTGYVDVFDYGGPGKLSTPAGVPVQDSQGNVYVACGTGDISASPTLYFGAVAKFSFGPGGASTWDGISNPAENTFHIFGYGDGAYPTSMAAGDINGDGIEDLIVATSSGGVYGVGTITIFSPGGSVLNAISLISSNGTDMAGMTVGPAGSLICSFQAGGTGNGTLFPFISNSLGFDTGIVLHNFNGLDGNIPTGSPTPGNSFTPRVVQKAGVKANDNTLTNYILYGVTLFGGTNGNGPGTGGYGTVYSINNDGSGFQMLHVFSASGSISTNGYGPHGGMVLSGNTLYGTTSGGGANGSGEVFKMDTSGSNFMVLKSFSGYGFDSASNLTNSDGEAPEGDLILSGDTLYGTTLGGGTNGGGVVWSMNTNGGSFTVLHSFSTPTDNGTGTGTYTNVGGGGTRSGLLLSGHILFGTTPYGGIYGGGTLFAIILPSPPLLNLAPVGGKFAVSWPSAATNFMLQQNLTLNSLTWSNFNGTVNDDGTNKSISILPAAGSAFFRLLSTNGL